MSNDTVSVENVNLYAGFVLNESLSQAEKTKMLDKSVNTRMWKYVVEYNFMKNFVVALNFHATPILTQKSVQNYFRQK